MGTYSYDEFYRIFGGAPEPGEAYLSLDAVDEVRKAAREDPAPVRDVVGEFDAFLMRSLLGDQEA